MMQNFSSKRYLRDLDLPPQLHDMRDLLWILYSISSSVLLIYFHSLDILTE